MYQENRLGLHRHIQCRTGQQPLQACPEGACRSFVFTKDDMGESQNAWVSYPISISILAKKDFSFLQMDNCVQFPHIFNSHNLMENENGRTS